MLQLDVQGAGAQSSFNFQQNVTLSNSGTDASGPVSLVITGLPSGVTLSNSAGSTVCFTPTGQPFVVVSANGISAGGNATVTLKFNNTQNQNSPTYNTYVAAGNSGVDVTVPTCGPVGHVDCPAPPFGCSYSGGTSCSCGALVCGGGGDSCVIGQTNSIPPSPIYGPCPTPNLTGTITKAPTCAVDAQHPDGCAVAYPTTIQVKTHPTCSRIPCNMALASFTVQTITPDANGNFSATVPEGNYTLVPDTGNTGGPGGTGVIMNNAPSCPYTYVTLSNTPTQVNIACDSGQTFASTSVPAGSLVAYVSTAAPTGWLVADGSAVSRTTYASLFAVIGTIYGSGDGNATFNLPDLRGRVPLGAGSSSGLTPRTLGSIGGTEQTSGIPVDLGDGPADTSRPCSTCELSILSTAIYSSGSATTGLGGSLSDSNMPPYQVLTYLIKADNYSSLPAGAVLAYNGNAVPSGWVPANGTAVSRASYSSLFSAAGTRFGTGDGSATFNLPDLRSRVLLGSGIGSGLTSRSAAATGGNEQVTALPATSGAANSSRPNGNVFANSGANAIYSSGPATVALNGTTLTDSNMPPYEVSTYIVSTVSVNTLPDGVIFPTAATAIPSGWVRADGSTSGVPDLRGRYVVGSGQGSGLTNRVVGSTGGQENITAYPASPFAGNASRPSASSVLGNSGSISIYVGGATTDDALGGSNADSKMIPYVALNYITKGVGTNVLPPTITLNGSNPAIVTFGTNYSDAGASAVSSLDGNLTSHIVVTGSVDASTPGVYTLTYNVNDSVGNSATPVTRTVNNYGGCMANFSALGQGTQGWKGVAVDSSTHDVYAIAFYGDIYKQTGGTGNFMPLNQSVHGGWQAIAVDSSNHNVYAVDMYRNDVFVQTGGTGDFTAMNVQVQVANKNRLSGTNDGIAVDSSTHDVYVVDGVLGLIKQPGGTGSFVSMGNSGITFDGVTVYNLNQISAWWSSVAVNPSTHTIYIDDLFGHLYKQTGGTGNFVYQTDSGINAPQALALDSGNSDLFIEANSPDWFLYKQAGGIGGATALEQIAKDRSGIAVDSSTHSVYYTSSGHDIYKMVCNYPSFQITGTVIQRSVLRGVNLDNPVQTTVQALDSNNNVVQSTVSDSNGAFTLPVLPSSTYTIRTPSPQGLVCADQTVTIGTSPTTANFICGLQGLGR